MELGPDREFGFRAQPWVVGAGCLGFLLAPILAAGQGVALSLWHLTRSGGGLGPSLALPASALVLPVLGLAVLALCGYLVVLGLALQRRGHVLTTRMGIVVRDRRGREQRLGWHEIDELRAGSAHPRTWNSAAVIEVLGSGKRLLIEDGIEDREELTNLIIAQAGLEGRTAWWGGTYRRPATMEQMGDDGREP